MTTAFIIDLIKKLLKNHIEKTNFSLPAGRDVMETPKIYKYFFPINLKAEDKQSPYIVLGFDNEEQELWQNTDESDLKLILNMGFSSDDEEIEVNIETLLSALENIEMVLKDNSIIDGVTLRKVKKIIPNEQPIPYLEGKLILDYSYYKPVLLEEP